MEVLSHLVDDLLEVARVTQGKIELHKEAIDLQTLVRRSVQSLRSRVDERGQDLKVDIPEPPLRLYVDSTRIEQVLTNLLVNASRYTPAGGVIRLAVRIEEGEELSFAVLEVSDNGIGIPKEALTDIFDLFRQVERQPHRTGGGLGIGLTVVKGLVELHGGTVSAASEGEGKGATFTVRIPIVEPPRSEEPDGMKEAEGTKAMRVLVIEDNEDAALMLAELLKLEGHQVQVAHNGFEGLRAFEVFSPHLAIIDIGLPDMDGYEVAREARRRSVMEHVPLVALTGYGQETDRERARAAGFDHHLVKPVDLDALLKLLGEIASTAPPSAAGDAPGGASS